MISCDNAAKLLSDYLDKTLDSEMYNQVREHLKGCKACSKVFANVSYLNSRLKSAQKLKTSADFDQKLRARIQSGQAEKRPVMSMRGLSAGLSGVAVCAALTFFVVSDFSSTAVEPEQLQPAPKAASSQPVLNPSNIQQASAAPVTKEQLSAEKDSLKKETIPVDQNKIKLAGQEK